MTSRGYLGSLATQAHSLFIFKRGERICDDLVNRLESPKHFAFLLLKEY